MEKFKLKIHIARSKVLERGFKTQVQSLFFSLLRRSVRGGIGGGPAEWNKDKTK